MVKGLAVLESMLLSKHPREWGLVKMRVVFNKLPK